MKKKSKTPKKKAKKKSAPKKPKAKEVKVEDPITEAPAHEEVSQSIAIDPKFENIMVDAKDLGGDLRINSEEFKHGLESQEQVDIPKHRFSKDLEGILKGNLKMEKMFGSMINKTGSIIPSAGKLMLDMNDGANSDKDGPDEAAKGEEAVAQDKGSNVSLSRQIEKTSSKVIELAAKNTIGESYVGDKESTILNSMLMEKGENPENFFKRGTLVMPAPTPEYNQMVLKSLGIEGQIKEENERFPVQTGGPPSDKKKKSSNFEENFKLEFKRKNPFLQKSEEDTRKRVQSEFVKAGAGPPKPNFRERTRSEKKVRFPAENIAVQIGSNVKNVPSEEEPAHTAEQEEEMFRANLKTASKQKTRKGKTFVETMTNIYKDLDQTLNEVENVNNEPSIDEGPKPGFEYQELKADEMAQKPLNFYSSESEKESPEDILKKSDTIGINLEDFVKKKTAPETPKEESVPETLAKSIEAEERPTKKKKSLLDKESPKRKYFTSGREIQTNLLSKFIKISPKIYQHSRKGSKYIINVEDNLSHYTSVSRNNARAEAEAEAESKQLTSTRNNLSSRNSFRTRNLQIQVQSNHPSPKHKTSIYKGLSSLRVSPKKRFMEAVEEDSQWSPRFKGVRANYDTPLHYNRFIKETGSQPQSRREFKFIKRRRGRGRGDRGSLMANEMSQEHVRTPRFSRSGSDMETRLKILYKKLFVYQSKIEGLKMKLYKANGENLTYTLYRDFVNADSGHFDVLSLKKLFIHLNLRVEDVMTHKLILFLKKYADAAHESQLLLSNPSSNERNLTTPEIPLNLSYPHFRELFISHKIQLSELYLHSEWESLADNQGSGFDKSEYFLLRRIVLLQVKQLKDVSRVMHSLRSLPGSRVFEFILSFGSRESQRYRSHSPSPGMSFSNNQYNTWNNLANTKERSLQFIPETDSKLTGASSQMQTEQTRKHSSKGNISENFGSSLLNKFIKKSTGHFSNLSTVKLQSPSYKNIDFTIRKWKNKGEEAIGRSKKVPSFVADSEAKVVDIRTIKALLTHLGIEYLAEDLSLLMNVLGSTTGYLMEHQFLQFFNSRVWEY